MIQIDMPMPEKCSDCIFCDDNCSCVASDYNGIGINVGCAYRTGRRDIRCPLKEQDCNCCGIVFDVAYKAGKADAVVRCKDCKHRPKEIPFTTTWGRHDTYLEFPEGSRCPCQCSGDPYYSWNPDDEWFCADGEHK